LLGDLRARGGHRLRIARVVAAGRKARLGGGKKKSEGREETYERPHDETPSRWPIRHECSRARTIHPGSALRNTLVW